MPVVSATVATATINVDSSQNPWGKILTRNDVLSSNIHKSLLTAKDQCEDLIYFVEDDYLHQQKTIKEMILAYERISSQIQRELILCPVDYPYLYQNIQGMQLWMNLMNLMIVV